jgi:hypothetical protein
MFMQPQTISQQKYITWNFIERVKYCHEIGVDEIINNTILVRIY